MTVTDDNPVRIESINFYATKLYHTNESDHSDVTDNIL